MKIYLAGPMRGIKDFNFPAFTEATRMLRELGHEVFSPAEADLKRDPKAKKWSKSETGDIEAAEKMGFNRRDAIRDDLNYIIDHAEAIALLPGWEKSKGARTEFSLAEFLDLEVIQLVPAPKQEETVTEAV